MLLVLDNFWRFRLHRLTNKEVISVFLNSLLTLSFLKRQSFVCDELVTNNWFKGVGRHRQGGAMPPLARKFFHFDHWSDQKSGLSPPPGNWKMAGEPSPGAPESPPLEKFLPTPLLLADRTWESLKMFFFLSMRRSAPFCERNTLGIHYTSRRTAAVAQWQNKWRDERDNLKMRVFYLFLWCDCTTHG